MLLPKPGEPGFGVPPGQLNDQPKTVPKELPKGPDWNDWFNPARWQKFAQRPVRQSEFVQPTKEIPVLPPNPEVQPLGKEKKRR